MRVIRIDAQSFGSNTYCILSGVHAWVVDPSVSIAAISSALAEEGASLDGILLTHGHFDHMLSLDTLRKTFSVEAWIHEADAAMLTDGKKNAFYNFFGKERVFLPAENLFEGGDVIPIGEEKIRVIHTPGHTQGSVCFLCGKALITGDTLFSEGYGRYDLWGGDREDLQDSLRRLGDLDPGLRICPGHGAVSSLGTALCHVEHIL